MTGTSFGRHLAVLVAMSCVSLVTACQIPCAEVDVRPIDLRCDDPPIFTGEVHFVTAQTYDTFLRQECLYDSATPEEIDALVLDVDFDSETVFVAVGPANIDANRCLESRSVDAVESCNEGVRVYFNDEYKSVDASECDGPRWTAAFVADREAFESGLVTVNAID